MHRFAQADTVPAMRILVTNDDGYRSEGLSVLAGVASRFGDPVVVAPSRDRSAISQAISLTSPLMLREGQQPGWYELTDGTPADCVYIGLHHVMVDDPPDLVLSGINPGPNLGWDVHYSGTVAAAREAVLQEVPGLAFSLVSGGQGFPFEELIPWIERCIQLVLDDPPPAFTFLNVNMPNPRVKAIRGLRATRLGHRTYRKEVDVRTDPRGRQYMWIGGSTVHMPDMPGSDCNAIRESFVSVTPVGCDTTAHPYLETMKHWND